jgi:ribosomal protein S18 acetylase RimI-like enzyme
MPGLDADSYAAAFESRCAASGDSRAQRVDGPGVRGLVSFDAASKTQLLVLDDRALSLLDALLPLASAGTIRVYRAARRCAGLLQQDARWSAKPVTAMVCSELHAVPEPPLPPGLSRRSVRRVPEDAAGGVPLFDAVMAAERAAAPNDVIVDELVTHLTVLPPGSRILAAVDDDGVVRGTSASRTFGTDAYVFFVNTDPDWRRRGVGLSMTAAALRCAASTGATRASLDASGPAAALYRRLGFTAGAAMTQFSRTV